MEILITKEAAEEFCKELDLRWKTKAGIAMKREIIMQVRDPLDLVQTGRFAGSFHIDEGGADNEVAVFSTAPYSIFLEFGNYEYYDMYGMGIDSFPFRPDKKKKDMTATEKLGYPKGMQPFAMFRRSITPFLKHLKEVFN